MLKQLRLKKEYLLAAATVVLLLLSYELAFKKTIAAWQLNHSLKAQLAQTADVSVQPEYQLRKNTNLGHIIDLYKADTTKFRNQIIASISALAEKENVKLTEVPTRDPLYYAPQFIIQKLNFEGDYFSLTKVLNRLQKAGGIGLIRGVAFRTVKQMSKENGQKLVLEIYFEILNK
jgi:hypothetical protein